MIKILSKVGTEGIYLNITKVIYDKPTARIILNSQKLKVFPLISRKRLIVPLLPLLFSIAWEAKAIKQAK